MKSIVLNLVLLSVVAVACSAPIPVSGPVSTDSVTPAVVLTATPVTPIETPVVQKTPTPTIVPATPILEPKPAFDPQIVYARELYRGKPFESPEDWLEKLETWTDLRPPHPGALAGFKGFSAAMRVGRKLDADKDLLNDKWKHCVLGVEIGLETGIGTAEFAAWLKEYRDLTDGLASTVFDELDFDATLDGARQAAKASCSDCSESLCDARWGNRYEVWSRSEP